MDALCRYALRASALLTVLSLTLGAPGLVVAQTETIAATQQSADVDETATGPADFALWGEPLGTLAFAPSGTLYLTVGTTVAVEDNLMFSASVTALNGNFYGCGSDTTGGWAVAGPAWSLGDSALTGPYIHPRLHARWFDTTDAAAASGGWVSSCSGSDAAHTNGTEVEVSIGLDIGYHWRLGPIFLGPVIGVNVGFCSGCPGQGPLSFGDLTGSHPARQDRGALGLNINLVQLGLIF